MSTACLKRARATTIDEMRTKLQQLEEQETTEKRLTASIDALALISSPNAFPALATLQQAIRNAGTLGLLPWRATYEEYLEACSSAGDTPILARLFLAPGTLPTSSVFMLSIHLSTSYRSVPLRLYTIGTVEEFDTVAIDYDEANDVHVIRRLTTGTAKHQWTTPNDLARLVKCKEKLAQLDDVVGRNDLCATLLAKLGHSMCSVNVVSASLLLTLHTVFGALADSRDVPTEWWKSALLQSTQPLF
jgi:hypothetical protein